MFVNANHLRLRQNDRTVVWVKRGDKIDVSLFPLMVIDRLKRRNQLISDSVTLGSPMTLKNEKKAPKVTNKKMPTASNKKKAVKKGK